MTLEEQLKTIPEDEWLYLICGEKEFLGYKHHILQGNLYLDKEVKTVQICWFDDKGLEDAVLQIEVKK